MLLVFKFSLVSVERFAASSSRTKGGQVGTTAETGTKGGRPGGDNGRGVKAVSGGGSEGDGGDDVEWVGEAQKAVGGGGGTKR